MNKIEIANLFIKAAIIDRRLPSNAAPAKLKGSWIPFVHSETDVKSRIRTNISFGEFKEQLLPDDDPFEEWLKKMFNEDEQRLKPEDIADWERANELIKLVANEDNRKALWNWAKAKAETLAVHVKAKRKTLNRKTKLSPFGKVESHKTTHRNASFAEWCRSQGFHEMTGSRRKDRALVVIEQQLTRAASPNAQSWDLSLLPVGPVLEHISVTLEADVPSRKDRFAVRDSDTVFCKEDTVFSWRKMREAERQRKADARKEQAA